MMGFGDSRHLCYAIIRLHLEEDDRPFQNMYVDTIRIMDGKFHAQMMYS